jgi:lipopolysaccharide export system permease protein
MRLLDRYLLRHFLWAYLACFLSLVALYTVIDLFTKMDEFTEHTHKFSTVCGRIGLYYGYRLPWFFDRLSGVLALLAALCTLAWLERQNELFPFLAAGIPMRRLLYPVLAATVGMIGLAVANREWLVPLCSPYLQRSPDNPTGRGPRFVQGAYDANWIHFEGQEAYPDRQMIVKGRITLPAHMLGRLVHLTCVEMFYRPANGRDSSGWYLMAASPARLDGCHPALNWLRPGVYFLHTDMSFQRLSRPSGWFHYEPTAALLRLLRQHETFQRRAEVIALVHHRLTAPLLEFLLVLQGIALILGRTGVNLYVKLGIGLIVYAVFMGVQYVCRTLSAQEFLNPVLAAWLPVLVFGPVALAQLDGIRT